MQNEDKNCWLNGTNSKLSSRQHERDLFIIENLSDKNFAGNSNNKVMELGLLKNKNDEDKTKLMNNSNDENIRNSLPNNEIWVENSKSKITKKIEKNQSNN